MRSEPGRSAEVLVYQSLARTLDDSYAVFYSVPWLGRTRDGYRRDGEADFLVVSEDYGLLVLEVKGGREVGHDARTRRWYSVSQGGERHDIRDPYDQAVTSKHNLVALLRERVLDGAFVPAAHAVVFPGVQRRQVNLGPGNEALTAFSDDLGGLGEFVVDVMSDGGRRGGAKAFTPAKRHLVEQYCGRSFRLTTSVAADVSRSELQILDLSERQLELLSFVRRNRRVEVTGGAGTGKTMLAKAAAVRLAAEGLRVAWVCYNRPLRDHVAAELAAVPGVEVFTFHQLCVQLAAEAAISLPSPDSGVFFDAAADALLDALDAMPDRRFDALVVDEAQDLRPEWWEGLLFSLSDPEEDVVYAFRDDNQLFYGAATPLHGAALFSLDRNLRNTRPIHALVRQLYAGPVYESGGVSGPSPALHEVETSEEVPARVRSVVQHLLQQEGFSPGQVVVLTCRGRATSSLHPGHDAGVTLAWLGDPMHEAVGVETVRRFKGLESPVVVLCELDALSAGPSGAELGYVGLTRARGYLAVVGTADELRDLQRLHGR